VFDIFEGGIKLSYYPSKIQNTDVIQVCRIDFLNVNRAVFATFLLPVARVNRPVNDMLSVIKDRYEATRYATTPI
jgi:hypothetical protein